MAPTLNPFNKLGHNKKIILKVAGGLGAQLFGIAYALLIASLKSRGKVVIQFSAQNHLNRGWHLDSVMKSTFVQDANIFSEVVRPRWRAIRKILGPVKGKLLHHRSKIFAGVSRVSTGQAVTVVSLDSLHREVSSARKVLNPRAEQYLSDFSVFEAAWPMLQQVLASLDAPENFLRNAASEPSISVHWRLGDFLTSSLHGCVSGEAVLGAITSARSKSPDFPVKFFSDSPDLVKKYLAATSLSRYELIRSSQNDIWSDLESMVRSSIFIGTNSAISFIAAMAVSRIGANPRSVFLPGTWFLNPVGISQPHSDSLRTFNIYDPCLSLFPLKETPDQERG